MQQSKAFKPIIDDSNRYYEKFSLFLANNPERAHTKANEQTTAQISKFFDDNPDISFELFLNSDRYQTRSEIKFVFIDDVVRLYQIIYNNKIIEKVIFYFNPEQYV